MASFKKVKFSLANEDSSIERAAAVRYSSILSVGGSGTRAFSLIHNQLKKITIIDPSEHQIEFIKFKWELIKKMKYEDYIRFMGYQAATIDQRLDIIESIDLSIPAIKFYRAIPEEYVERGIVYCGRWEAGLISIWKTVQSLALHNFKENFTASDTIETDWSRRRLRFLIKMISTKLMVNRYWLPVPIGSNSDIDISEFLINNIENIFLKSEPKNSFFHQFLFLGHLEFAQGWPVYISSAVFSDIKDYAGDIEFKQMGILEAIKTVPFEFGSFSMTPSQLNKKDNLDFESQLNDAFSSQTQKVIMRSFCRDYKLKHDRLRSFLNPGAAEFARHQDVTGLYRFQILEKST